MKTFFVLLLLIPQLILAQESDLWQEINASHARLSDQWSGVQVNRKTLNTSALNDMLATIKKNGKGTLPIPSPEGGERYFDVMPSSVLAPKLQAKYPEIQTYKGRTEDGETIRLSYGPNGLRATIFNKEGAYGVNPESTNSADYVSYRWSEYNQVNPISSELRCGSEDADTHTIDTGENSLRTTVADFTPRRIGYFHTKYRMAIIPDLDYVDYFGGTVVGALNGIATTLNTANEIYERDLGISIELIEDNDQFIYTDKDEYQSNEHYETIESIDRTIYTALFNELIGVENYDVAQVFKVEYSGGIAGYRSVCDDDRKGRAISGVAGGDPEGYIFDVTIFTHELGHQFGSLHTFSTDCAFNTEHADAFEVGSGVTIMGYYFDCGGSFNSAVEPTLDYFNIRSIEKIINYATSRSCGASIATGNTAPIVSVPVSGFTIPVNTPFLLEAEGSDADGDDITYCWEQYDIAVKEEDIRHAPVGESDEVFETVEEYMTYSEQVITDLDQFYIDEGYTQEEYQWIIDLVTRRHEGVIARFWEGDGPLFRSFYPNTENIRYFPELSKVVDGTADSLSFEVMPHKTRNLNFVVTVRDNSLLGAGIANDIVSFSSTADAGPFEVTSEFTENSYIGLGNFTLEWDVANTNVAPVNCQSVDVLYSTDGGENFDITIVSSLANDGSESIKLPNIATTEARIMVKATGNIFFNVNDRDFTVVASEVDVPEAPIALFGTRVGASTVELSWMHDGDHEDGFTIERRLELAADFEEIGQATVNATTYEDETVASHEAYVYRVAAFNATGTSAYTNVVTIDAVQETDILAFSLVEQTGSALINTVNHTVSIAVEAGTDITSLAPSITLSTGGTSLPSSGETVDFTDSQTYRLTSQDGSTTQNWLITVTVAEEALNTETGILTFSLSEQTKSATVNSVDHTVSIEVELDTDVTSLTPSITLSEGASSAPVNRIAVDFTDPVTYTVTSEDGLSSQDWQVTVTISTTATVLVTGIMLNDNQGSVAVDGTYSLIASLAPTNATNQNVTWDSDNQAVAIVDSEGIVSGIAVGAATILATTEDGRYTDTFEVTVVEGGTLLSTAKNQSDVISIYPNPVSGMLYTNIKAVKVEVLSLIGDSKEMKVIQGVIDVSELAKGLYLIKTPQQQFVRFIKK